MAVYKDKERGTWYADIRYSIDGVKHSHKKRGFELKRDALNYEADFRRNLVVNEHTLTLGQAVTEYLQSNNSRPDTKKQISRRLSVFLDKYYQDKVKSFKPQKILSIIEEMKESDFSKSYINYTFSHFKAVLRYAHTNYNISTKYELIKKLPRDTSDIKTFETWNDDEFNKFIECVDHVVYKSLFILLYKTGLRRGEALALEYSDLNDNFISITKSYRRTLGQLKNLSSHRTIMIDGETKRILNNLKVDGGRLFFGVDNYLSLSTIQRVFSQGIKDSKVKPIRIHDLRHSHATNLINKGANIVAVSKRLGHSDIKMTISTYTNVLAETEKELIKLL